MNWQDKKRIWIWNHYASKMFINRGGRHYSIAKYLKELGYEVTIFCANTVHGSDKMIDTGIGRHVVQSIDGIEFVFVKTSEYRCNNIKRIVNIFLFYRNVKKVAKIIGSAKGLPDLILASSVHPLTLVAGLHTAKKFSIPCICEIRDLWPESIIAYGSSGRKNLIIKWLYYVERKIYEKANGLVFTMEGGADYIVEMKWDLASGGRVDPSKIYHLNNGVDLVQFDKDLEKYKGYLAELFPDDSVNFVYVGSIREVNNLELILEPVASLLSQNINIRFILIGDGTERPYLEEKYKEYWDRIHFVGSINKKYVPSVLAQADFCVMCSKQVNLYRYGVSPNKLFDYLAAGKPILSLIRSSYDLIKQYHLGTVARDQSNLEIERAVIDLISLTTEEREQIGVCARRIAQEFDYRVLTERLTKIIDRILVD